MEEARCRADFPGNKSSIPMIDADFPYFTSKSVHISPNLPGAQAALLVNWVNLRTNQTQSSEIEIKNGTGPRIDLPMSL